MNQPSLQSVLDAVKQQDSYPLEKWQPTHISQMNILIKSNGEWWHEGEQIQKQRMVNFFSRLLWQEEGQFYLKTPIEKIKIEVEDAPFIITSVFSENDKIYLSTMQHDKIEINAEHPIVMNHDRPYILVRFGLYALIQRSVFYHLVEMGELSENKDGKTILSLQSGDFCFHLQA